jgi:hypothetical protein
VGSFSSSYPLLNHTFFKRERGCPFFWDSPLKRLFNNWTK